MAHADSGYFGPCRPASSPHRMAFRRGLSLPRSGALPRCRAGRFAPVHTTAPFVTVIPANEVIDVVPSFPRTRESSRHTASWQLPYTHLKSTIYGMFHTRMRRTAHADTAALSAPVPAVRRGRKRVPAPAGHENSLSWLSSLFVCFPGILERCSSSSRRSISVRYGDAGNSRNLPRHRRFFARLR